MTDRLSEAFKLAGISVTEEQERDEEEFLEQRKHDMWSLVNAATTTGLIRVGEILKEASVSHGRAMSSIGKLLTTSMQIPPPLEIPAVPPPDSAEDAPTRRP